MENQPPRVDGNDLADGSSRILIVEDEDIIRDSLRESLELIGHSVHDFADGSDALTFYRDHHTEIDLVILDMIMPKMNGSAILKEMRHINPNIKAIFASGYMGGTDPAEAKAVGASAVVTKPYRIATLSQCIADVLSEDQGEA